MTDNYIGEIRLFSFGYAPDGWHICDGSILEINKYAALFSLIGNTFGGDGVKNFALPDLRGRVMLNAKIGDTQVYKRGAHGGNENVVLSQEQMPLHNHQMEAENAVGNVGLSTNLMAIPQSAKAQGNVPINAYNSDISSKTTLNVDTIMPNGGGLGHNNMQPFLTLNPCIAIQGYYPPRPN